eukprot:4169453-Prymnesium_polylepis.1
MVSVAGSHLGERRRGAFGRAWEGSAQGERRGGSARALYRLISGCCSRTSKRAISPYWMKPAFSEKDAELVVAADCAQRARAERCCKRSCPCDQAAIRLPWGGTLRLAWRQ